MANKYFTQLTQLAAGSISSGDAIAIEDISAGETKHSTAADFATYVSSTLAASSGGWDAVADTWTYLGAGTVLIPSGGTLLYGKGDKIRFEQGGTQLYFSAIEVGGTTLKLTGGSDYTLGTAAISNIYYSKIENPLNFPDTFSYTATPTGFSANPTAVARFSLRGKICTLFYRTTGAGTSNATTFTVVLPIAGVAGLGAQIGVLADGQDAGVYIAAGVIIILSGGTTAGLYKSAEGAWTNNGAKYANFVMSYEI